ncbi:MAG: flagellar hook-basal body complex protein [Pirellulales bacterium]|nr:flagellar hook-basal body complex protein [Pirellulales bacterium]
MGLASALNTALTGLNASETTIDVVGNNLANAGTVGFKASEANFATQFLQTRSLGSGPSDQSGGTNPRQIGLGVQVAEITPDFSQGTIQVSSSPSDLAIQGDGFFIVSNTGSDQFYTRNGIFKTNASNELVTITGQKLLGYGVDQNFDIQSTTLQPLVIPLGSEAVAQATANVFFEGTLTPTGDVANTAEIIQSGILGDALYDHPSYPTSSTDILVANPPTAGAFAGASAGAGAALAAGTYIYRVVYYGKNGTETSSTTIPVTLGGASSGINLTSIPTDGTGDYTGRRIYRTPVGGTTTSPAYLVADLANQTTTSFNDTTTDAALVTGSLQNTNLLTGQYQYYVTFSNTSLGTLESRPSAIVGPINVTGDRIRLDNLPAPTGEFAGPGARINIYRNTSSQTTTYYRLATIDPTTTTTGEVFVDNALDSAIIANPVLDFDGPKINSGTLLSNVVSRDGSNYENLFGPGTLSFEGIKGGRTLDAKTLTITAATTVQDLVNFMQDSFGIQLPDSSNGIPVDITGAQPGGSVLTSGRIQFIGNNGVDNALDIGLSGFKFTPTGSNEVETPDMGFTSTQTAKGQSAVSDFIVYDSLGIPLNVRVTAVMESRDSTSTTYRWFADSPDNDPLTGTKIAVGTGTIRFDGEGNVISFDENTVSIDRRNVSSVSPLEFDLDFSKLSGLAANRSTLSASRQDGSGAGELSSFIIGEDGIIRGVFSNGTSRDLGQIVLARFANPTGLEQKGENLYSTGVNSGLPIQGRPGEQGIGSIIAGAIELSNTDIGKNLIDLILASSQYRGNTRVVTTAQQLLDELLNLQR